MQRILAIDAGGTSTRAALITDSGDCLGVGLAGSGNPVAVGPASALAAVLAATRNAIAHSGENAPELSTALVAMAGANPDLPAERIGTELEQFGLAGTASVAPDLLATYFSGTFRPDGFALVAGTGSIAARVAAGALERVSGGTGWLLGDAGSGYWIGHRVVRAVIGAVDGTAPATALTVALTDALGVTASSEVQHGRPRALTALMESLYALRPVELARFAPLAFAAGEDAVAGRILGEAASELVSILNAVRPAGSAGPVVLGGGLLGGGLLGGGVDSRRSPLTASLALALGDAEIITVADGLVGAAVLGLTQAGIEIDARLFERLSRQVSERRA